jgi:hypothetical protein
MFNSLMPYTISIGIIIYAALLINHANMIIDDALKGKASSTNCDHAKTTQGFAITLLCLGIVIFLATVNNRHPGLLDMLTVFAKKGGNHPFIKYAMIIGMLIVCSIILSTLTSDSKECGSKPTLLIIINSILVGCMGIFLMYKMYEIAKNKKFD